MAGYLGTKAVLLSTTAATVTGDMTVGGAATISGAFTSKGIDDNATSTKLTVSDTGVDVTGTVTADGLTVDGNGTVNGQLEIASTAPHFKLTDTDATGFSRILGNNGNIYLDADPTNQNDNSQVYIRIDGKNTALFDDTGDISFYEDTGTTPKFFWDASAGSLGIGTSSPSFPIHVNNTTSYLALQDSDGVIEGSMSSAVRLLTGDGTEHGQLGFLGTASGIMLLRNLQGDLYLEADVRDQHTNSFMRFAVDNSEAMRIDASGNLLVGKTASSSAATGFEARAAGFSYFTNAAAPSAYFRREGTAGAVVSFVTSGGVGVGSISVTASATAYNTSSDYRLKEDWVPMVGASERVQALKPINFAWKVDGSRVDGFLAHELAEVVPEAATGAKDAMRDEEYEITPAVEATYDAEGVELTPAAPAVMGTHNVPDYQGIDQSKLVPLLTAALQEAITEITALKARVTALEAV